MTYRRQFNLKTLFILVFVVAVGCLVVPAIGVTMSGSRPTRDDGAATSEAGAGSSGAVMSLSSRGQIGLTLSQI